MRIISLSIIALITILSWSMVSNYNSSISKSNDKRESTILYTMMGITDYLHFNPKKVNDNLSKEIYKDYLENLDPSKRFLLKSEVELLRKHEYTIDNEINKFRYDFFNDSEEIFLHSIDRARNIYLSLIETGFDINEEEVFELDGKKRKFANDELELAGRWRKFLKYNVVSKIDSYQDNEKYTNTSIDSLQLMAEEDVKELFDDWFKRIDKTRREDRLEEYLNTIIQQNDPHSVYFSPKQQENFAIKMGNKLEGIGAQLQQADEYVKVYSIVPGGPAWKGKNLEVDDIIVAVTQEGEETVDITGMRLDDVIRIIRGDKGTKVLLKVKKKSGVYKTIGIVRDEIILDDAAAKSVIIGLDKEVENIGYIHLPLFYSTFDGGNSCATDVAEELEKLSKENVQGIILDLRYNGGGSLPDAIDMAGLFIEKGPVVQVKPRKEKSEVYSDENPSVSYDGPLIVLVNNVSASSSEILAGALQDYKRAIIVGGQKTYGKGTVQGLYDLDRMIDKADDIESLGQVKLTTQKFYRISGKSNQLRGIVPDINLPDQFDYVDYGEHEYEDALPYNEIASVKYSQDVYTVKKVDQLKKKSKNRIASDKNFDQVNQLGQLMAANEDATSVPISLNGYKDEMDKRAKLMEPFDNLFEENVPGMMVKNIAADKSYIEADESRTAKNIDFIESVTTDFYLKEALLIMKDMIEVDERIAHK